MNMTTSLDDIPLKTMKNQDNNFMDDSEDPMVKDILNEFQQELEINNKQHQPQKPIIQSSTTEEPAAYPPYKINYNPINERKIKKEESYYNEEYIKKSVIIGIITFSIFSPVFFNIIIQKLPEFLRTIIETYELYVKLGVLLIAIYFLFYNKII